MKNVKNKVKNIMNNKINELCPFESIILYYMIQLSDQGKYTDITINELYYIVDIYNKSFNSTCDGHEHCLCKKSFNTISPIEDKLNKSNLALHALSILSYVSFISNFIFSLLNK